MNRKTLRMLRARGINLATGVLVGKAPTEFRLWAWGKVPTDKGDFSLTRAGAKKILARFAARGVSPLVIDYDHLSILTDRPATAGQAAGWFRAPEVRSDGLWVVGVEWCAEAKAGLEAKPPKWRYFSPAFRDAEDGTIVELVNVALCCNPATWGATALATRGGGPVDEKELIAQLIAAAQALAEGAESEEVKAFAAEIVSKLRPMLPEGEAGDAMVANARKAAMADDEPKDDKGAEQTTLAGLQAQIKALSEKGDKDDLIALNRNRLTAAQIPWARRQTLAALKDYLTTAPVIEEAPAPGKGIRAPGPAPSTPEPGSKVVTVDGKKVLLSAADVNAAKQMGTPLEKTAAFMIKRGIANIVS